MRNNQDRLGGAHTPQSDVPQTEGGGLSFVVPTEHVELPSKGLYYSPDHPLHGKETVEIRFMTAKDEDTLTSKNLIKKGVVIDKLIADLVIDKHIRTESLLIGDRNAIIVAARISGYGPDYDTKVNCPSCSKAQEYSFDLQNPSVHYALDEEALENLGITQTEDGLMHYVLPMSKFKISFKLPTGREEKMLVEKLTSKTIVHNETNATDILRMMIVAVNDVQDKHHVEQLIANLPARDSIYFKKLVKMITPNVSFNSNFECRFCGFDTEMEVPFTADFFWVNR
jgi:hypothetical protein